MYHMKQDIYSEDSTNNATKRVVVYRLQPTTFFGRVVATVITVLALGVMFMFSIALFSVLLVGIVSLVIFALWKSHRSTGSQGRIIDVEPDRDR